MHPVATCSCSSPENAGGVQEESRRRINGKQAVFGR